MNTELEIQVMASLVDVEHYVDTMETLVDWLFRNKGNKAVEVLFKEGLMNVGVAVNDLIRITSEGSLFDSVMETEVSHTKARFTAIKVRVFDLKQKQQLLAC